MEGNGYSVAFLTTSLWIVSISAKVMVCADLRKAYVITCRAGLMKICGGMTPPIQNVDVFGRMTQ